MLLALTGIRIRSPNPKSESESESEKVGCLPVPNKQSEQLFDLFAPNKQLGPACWQKKRGAKSSPNPNKSEPNLNSVMINLRFGNFLKCIP